MKNCKMRIFKTVFWQSALWLNIAMSVLASAASPDSNQKPSEEFKLGPASYLGQTPKGNDVHMHVQSMPERVGSYLIFLRWAENAGMAYLADPLKEPGEYGMTPLSVKEDGDIGPADPHSTDIPNPSLTLSLIGAGSSKSSPELLINDSQSGNPLGFHGEVSFKKGSTFKLQWSRLVPGTYDDSNFWHWFASATMSVGIFDANHEASASFSGKHSPLHGKKRILERWQNLYAVYDRKTSAEGTEVDTLPVGIIVVLDGRPMLINPNTNTITNQYN